MKDLNFEKVWFKLTDFEPAAAIQTPELRDIAENFKTNIARVHALIGFMPRLIGIAMRHQLYATIATLELTGHPILTQVERDCIDLTQQIQGRQEKYVNDAESDEIDNSEMIGKFTRKNAKNMMLLLHRYGEEGSPQVEAILITMLTGLWAAFEALIEDLYIAATKSAPPNGLFIFNNARKEYSLAFASNYPRIGKAIDQSVLTALHELRNLFIHNAGVIGQRFMKNSVDVPELARFRQLGTKAKVHCTGDMIPEFAVPMMAAASGLISGIDEWLILQQS